MRRANPGKLQRAREEYNPLGKVTRSTDPVGRETVLEYDTNGIDLLRTKQKNPASAGGYDLLQTATYNSLHEPLTITDAAGQTTTYTYNTQGQILTMTTPLRSCTGCAGENRTTTWSYDTNGYLQSVTRPATGATTSYTYDGYGRVRTVTDEDGYVLTYDYDALDRPTKTTYPDSTYEETAYNRLDAEKRRDRLGRWTHAIHDALRRVVSTRDPAGRTTTQQWCSCGSLDKLIDANGNAITWERDLQGRVTRELRADSSDTELVYEATTSRVKQVKDAKDQVRDLLYFSDNTLRQISYSNAPIPSPTVSFTYDPSYRCLATRQDGEGTTTYSYYPIGTPPVLGAGQVSTVDGPLSNDTTTFAYDELGRAVSRAINGVAVSHTYDVLGRLTQESNPLGTFTFAYVGTTGRIGSVTYPNGQTTTLDYLDNVGDHRLKEIHNKLPGGATLSKFNYASDAAGRFNSWTQQVGAGASTVYEYGYDLADQLTAATLKATAPPSVLKSYGYGYDKAGNRTSESIDSVVTAAAFNTVNRLQTQQVGGPLRFAGSVNEAATVTVGGAPAVVGGDNRFQGSATVTTGTNAVPIVSTDPSGNVRTNTYQVTVSGVNKTFTHDPNGNLTADGTRTFEWDAADHLVAVNQGTRRSEFTYDGDDRRVRIVEKDGPAVLSDQRFIWCGDTICEERDGAGTTVVRRFFHLGMQEGGAGYFYSTDHLGSVRELTDGSAALRARYDYDPYGRMTKVSGDKDAAFGFTGHYSHAPSGLSLAIYRAYDPSLARWISEDPIGLEGRDLNFYRYGANGPLNAIDPTGESVIIWVAVGAAAGLFLVTWVATQHIQQHGLPPMPPPIVPPMTMPPFPPPQTKPPTPSPSPILVPPIQTPGGEKKCDDKRGCTCTCLGKVDPNWNPKDPKHGDRYVGHQDNKAECRAECKFRGFDNYQCN